MSNTNSMIGFRHDRDASGESFLPRKRRRVIPKSKFQINLGLMANSNLNGNIMTSTETNGAHTYVLHLMKEHSLLERVHVDGKLQISGLAEKTPVRCSGFVTPHPLTQVAANHTIALKKLVAEQSIGLRVFLSLRGSIHNKDEILGR